MKNKGITLIALIITIIILLIIAGITINMTVGQRGIITRASEAGKNYQEEARKEEQELAKLWEESENILKGSGETTENKPNPPEGLEISIKALKAGDYIKYDTGVTSVGENGVIMCRVLYPVDSEYGLQIISDKTISNHSLVIKLGGSTWEEAKESYNGAIKTLNTKAETYINTTYAYDARCVGSIPTVRNGMFIDKNKGTETTVKLPVSGWTSYKRPTSWTTDDTGCYDLDTNYIEDEKALKTSNIWTIGEGYWLASRRVNEAYPYEHFGVRDVDSSGNMHYYSMCRVDYRGNISGYSSTNGLRICILLKVDNIKIIGGDGKSENTGYKIGI